MQRSQEDWLLEFDTILEISIFLSELSIKKLSIILSNFMLNWISIKKND